MALPHDAVAWSAVCDCGMSWPYSLLKEQITLKVMYPFTLSGVYIQPNLQPSRLARPSLLFLSSPLKYMFIS